MKEIYLTINGAEIIAYRSLRQLCRAIGSESKYWTANRNLKESDTYVLDGMTIKRINFHYKNG